MTYGYKTGGRQKGSKNKPKPVIVEASAIEKVEQGLAILAPTMPNVRSPKAVMLDAMLFFDSMAKQYYEQKQYEKAAKFMASAVQVAEKVSPYVHARLLAIESGERDQGKPSFVLRAPAVMADSGAWQEAVGAAVHEMEAQSASVVRQTEVAATQATPEPQNAPAVNSVALTTDPKTNRITVMPPGPRVVQPSGTQEWLQSVAAQRKAAG